MKTAENQGCSVVQKIANKEEGVDMPSFLLYFT